MKKSLCVALGGLVVLAGCQTVPYQGEARNVKRKPQENGIVAIPQKFRPEDRARAEDQMRSNCAPQPFKVVEEGESVIGQTTTSNEKQTERKSTERQVGNLFGLPLMSGEQGGKDTQTSSSVTQLKEWQIQYECEKASAHAPRKTSLK